MVNREEKYKDAGILVQIVITVALIMFVLLYLISNISSFATIVGMLVGLLLLAMAFVIYSTSFPVEGGTLNPIILNSFFLILSH